MLGYSTNGSETVTMRDVDEEHSKTIRVEITRRRVKDRDVMMMGRTKTNGNLYSICYPEGMVKTRVCIMRDGSRRN